MSSKPYQSRAFTLIEILIVVVILAILAGVVIASVSSASKDARESVLREELRFMRTQITLYRASHANPPGIDAAGNRSEEIFREQMTSFTDYDGNVSSTRDSIYRFGRYLTEMPTNPMNRESAVKVLDANAPVVPNDSEAFGWIYKPETSEFYANLAEYGPGGRNW